MQYGRGSIERQIVDAGRRLQQLASCEQAANLLSRNQLLKDRDYDEMRERIQKWQKTVVDGVVEIANHQFDARL